MTRLPWRCCSGGRRARLCCAGEQQPRSDLRAEQCAGLAVWNARPAVDRRRRARPASRRLRRRLRRRPGRRRRSRSRTRGRREAAAGAVPRAPARRRRRGRRRRTAAQRVALPRRRATASAPRVPVRRSRDWTRHFRLSRYRRFGAGRAGRRRFPRSSWRSAVDSLLSICQWMLTRQWHPRPETKTKTFPGKIHNYSYRILHV